MTQQIDTPDLFIQKQKWFTIMEVDTFLGVGCLFSGVLHTSGFEALVGTMVCDVDTSINIRWAFDVPPATSTYGSQHWYLAGMDNRVDISIKAPLMSWAFNPIAPVNIRAALYGVPIRSTSIDTDIGVQP